MVVDYLADYFVGMALHDHIHDLVAFVQAHILVRMQCAIEFLQCLVSIDSIQSFRCFHRVPPSSDRYVDDTGNRGKNQPQIGPSDGWLNHQSLMPTI